MKAKVGQLASRLLATGLIFYGTHLLMMELTRNAMLSLIVGLIIGFIVYASMGTMKERPPP